MTGGALVKPKDVLRPSVKNEVRIGKKVLNRIPGIFQMPSKVRKIVQMQERPLKVR